ncbi:choice-of-anchor P family protein [Nocardioides sp. SR21]|uniref:choice-of-anchor P family protein n=1 Tax=Nocardioides sp. SR21 TaxID=2919501 RepID=UPI001FAB0218|nr:choice-of-anchor P family protein [Nocardioides sp. SR21]
MRSAVTRALAAAGASVLTIGLLGLAPGTAHAQTGALERGTTTKADAGLALKAGGFGTQVKGGQIPGGSDETAYISLSCATRTGQQRENHVAGAQLPGAGTVSGITTKLWTTKTGGAIHSYAQNTTANVVLSESPLGSIEISALKSLSHAWHDEKGFHAETSVSVAKLLFVPPVGAPQELDIPTPGQPIEIPGVAVISIGGTSKIVNDHAGIANANVLHVKLIPSGTVVTVGHTTARVLDGIKHGTFRGSSAGTQVKALDDNLSSNRNPLSLMPCQGTDGEVQTKELAGVDLAGQIVVEGLRSSQQGTQLAKKSVAMERGSIASLNLGGGALVVDAVAGQANVTRTARGKVTSNAKGTTVGSITVNGEPQELPLNDPIEIPGLAKIEPKVIEKTRWGISVVALRITLLDGTGAVIDLGIAQAAIRG